MNKYEMMFIVKATQESEQVSKTAKNIESIVTSAKGKVNELKEQSSSLVDRLKNELRWNATAYR